MRHFDSTIVELFDLNAEERFDIFLYSRGKSNFVEVTDIIIINLVGFTEEESAVDINEATNAFLRVEDMVLVQMVYALIVRNRFLGGFANCMLLGAGHRGFS